MPGFNLSDYEPVEDRIRAFWTEHPDGQITTDMVHVGPDGYIVKASVWRSANYSRRTPEGTVLDRVGPDATGYAQEAVTERGVNATSALENCETSAIGRALANLGYAAKGKRPSREEMSKSSPPSEAALRPPFPSQESSAAQGTGVSSEAAPVPTASEAGAAKATTGDAADVPASASETVAASVDAAASGQGALEGDDAYGEGATTPEESALPAPQPNYLSRDDQQLLKLQYAGVAPAVKAYSKRFGSRITRLADITYEMRDEMEGANA